MPYEAAAGSSTTPSYRCAPSGFDIRPDACRQPGPGMPLSLLCKDSHAHGRGQTRLATQPSRLWGNACLSRSCCLLSESARDLITRGPPSRLALTACRWRLTVARQVILNALAALRRTEPHNRQASGTTYLASFCVFAPARLRSSKVLSSSSRASVLLQNDCKR